MNAVFIDTWGWITLAISSEHRHLEVLKYYQDLLKIQTTLFTSDYVMSETMTLLFKRKHYDEAYKFMSGLFLAIERKKIHLELISSQRFKEAWELRQRYSDKPKISFPDLTSMVIMQELGIRSVLTDDDHFLHVGMGFNKVP